MRNGARVVFALVAVCVFGLFCVSYFMEFAEPQALAIQPLPGLRSTEKNVTAPVTKTPIPEIQKRARELQGNCKRLEKQGSPMKNGSTHRFIVDKTHRLAYCPIEKVGCSFWKRVFYVLTHSKPGQRSHPLFDMSSVMIHRMGLIGSRPDRSVLNHTKTFLFVRDPFERLFSGYIDKVFTPTIETALLSSTIKKVVNDWRKTSAYSQEKRSRLKSNAYKQRLEKKYHAERYHLLNVTFSDFVIYVLKGKSVNSHFKPMWRRCPPCMLHYDYVGKMETFREDAGQILRSAGVNLTEMFGAESSFDESSDTNILHDVVKRTFSVMRSYSHDWTPAFKLRRTWTTFQIRGLISTNQSFPLSDKQASAISSNEFIDYVDYAYAHSGPREQRMRQRKAAMLEAFNGLPRNLLKELETYVRTDCLLFGYDCSVAKRFHSGEKPKFFINFEKLT